MKKDAGRRGRRFSPRFSIRLALLVTVACAALFAFWFIPAQRQKRAREWVDSQRGSWTLNQPYDPRESWYWTELGVPVPTFVVERCGIDFFATVEIVLLDCEEIYTLEPLTEMPGLEELYIFQFTHDTVNFEDLQQIKTLRKLEFLPEVALTADEIEQLNDRLVNIDVGLYR